MKNKILFTIALLGFLMTIKSFGQTISISGNVSAVEDNYPIPGTSIFVGGTTIGTISDIDGNFILNIPADAKKIIVSFIGYKTLEFEIKGRTYFEIKLVSDKPFSRNKSFVNITSKPIEQKAPKDHVQNISNNTQQIDKTPQNTGTVKDVDGNVYRTVKIGNQTWMAENLRTTKYNNEVSIPYAAKEVDWINFKADGFARYEYNTSQNKNYDLGAFYNFYTVNTKNLCPVDWHVPSENEWNVLIDFVGGREIAGTKLKSKTGWGTYYTDNAGHTAIGDGTDDYSFSIYPSKYISDDNGFFYIGDCFFWSSTKIEPGTYDDNRATAYTIYSYEYINNHPWTMRSGISVRCIKNSWPSVTNNKDTYGKKTGNWVTFFDDKWKEVSSAEDASFYRIANYNSGKPVGFVRDYYLTGNLQFEGNMKSENPDINTGFCKFFYPSGKLKSESNFIEGNRDGIYKEYYESGNIYALLNYSNGKYNGETITYHENGKRKGYLKYENGIPQGKYTEYYETGPLKLEKPYSNGKLNGLLKNYYDNGNLYSIGEFKNDLIEGKVSFYYNNGTIYEESYYINGKANGTATIYFESGKLAKSLQFKNNKMYGQQTFYNEDGSIKVRFDVDQFTDQRDGEIYPTVKIANYEWMGEYLRFNDPDGSDYAFNDEEETGSIGFVYYYETAKNVCPTGWRLPSKADLQSVINFYDDNGLASANLLEIFNEIQWIVPEPYKMDIEATNCGWTSDIDKDGYPYIYYLSSYDEDMDQNELSIEFLSSPDIEDAGIRCIKKISNASQK